MKNRKRFSTLVIGMMCAFAMLLTGVLHLNLFTNDRKADKQVAYAMSQGIIQGTDGDGYGTAESPWLVGSRDTLNTRVRNNAGTANRHFVLINDIDMNVNNVATHWAPIPLLAANSTFDGQGFTIKNLSITNLTTSANVGFFALLSGTVRNVNFEDVNISYNVSNTRAQGVGTVAGIAQGNSRVENVRVINGSINTLSHRVGGVVGGVSTAATNFTMVDVYNGASIVGDWGLGGILGHIEGPTQTVHVLRAMNTGSVHSARGGNAYSGGIVAILEGNGANLTIEWAINRGTLTMNNHTGGILGVAWSGSRVTIRNSINDAPINFHSGTHNSRGAIVANNSAGSLILENVWFNNSVFTGTANITNNMVNTTLVGGAENNGSQNQATIRADWWLEERGFDDVFEIDTDGNLTLAVFNAEPRFTHTFVPGLGAGETFTIREQQGEEFTLPYAGMDYFTTPTRTGYIFAGWSLDDGATLYALPGAPFTNTSGLHTTFTAMFRPAQFDIVTGGAGTTTISSGNIITIEDTNRIATNTSFQPGTWHWLVRVGDTENFVNVTPTTNPATLNLSDLLDAEFITDFVYFYGPLQSDRYNQPPVGPVGRIEIRSVDESTSTLIHTRTYMDGIQSPMVGGALYIDVDGAARPITLGNSVALPRPASVAITALNVNVAAHFRLVSIEIHDANDTYVQSFSGATSFDTNLVLAGMQNFTIVVKFERIEYSFRIIGAHTSDLSNPIPNAIVSQNHTEFSIGDNTEVTATAHSMVGNLRFIGWRIMLSDGATSVPAGTGLTFSRTFSNIDAALLNHYLSGTPRQITIIAEFAPTHLVSVNTVVGQHQFGTISVTVIDPHTGTHTTDSINDLNVSQGSRIIIYANPNPNGLFELDRFTGLPHQNDIISNTGGRIEFYVNAPLTVTAFFIQRQFDIVFRAVENVVNTVDGVSGFSAILDGAASATVGFGSSLQNLIAGAGSERAGFRFQSFSFLGEDGSTMYLYPQDLAVMDMFISLELLLANLVFIGEVRSFVITANYVRTFTLDVRHAISTEAMGVIEVFYVNGNEEEQKVDTTTHEFIAGDEIVIRARAHDFHSLVSITGGNVSFTAGDEYATITNIRSSGSVTVRFEAMLFTLGTNLGERIVIDRYEDLRPGSTIRLSVSPPSGRQANNWIINGRNVNDLTGADFVRIDENTIQIRLSIAVLNWLEVTPGSETFQITSTADFGLTTGVLMAILLPGILIPLLLAGAAFYYFRSRKKYASIKAELVAANRQKLMFNQASVIQDLKDGKNAGQVTDADVKQAMKDKKKKDK